MPSDHHKPKYYSNMIKSNQYSYDIYANQNYEHYNFIERIGGGRSSDVYKAQNTIT